jgi:hypothetical protein
MPEPRKTPPNPAFGRKPPTYIYHDANPGMSVGVILSIVVAILVAAGAMWYGVRMPTMTGIDAPSTYGKGTQRVEPPFIKAMTPAPVTPPAPQALPMPAPEPTPPVNTAPNP